MLGWSKRDVDETDLSLLIEVLKKSRGENKVEIDEQTINEAKERIEEWQKKNSV